MPVAGRKEKSSKKKPSSRSPAARRPASRGSMAALATELREIAVLGSVGAVIGWDQETMMPKAGAALRAKQRETISGMTHERRVSKKLGDLLSASEAEAERLGDEALIANLREVRRDYERATKLPAKLVAEITRCASLGMEAWKEARQRSDFTMFLPWLAKTFTLSREKASCYGVPRAKKGQVRGELYDALLDEYEPGVTAAQTQAIFGPLRDRLVPLIADVKSARGKPSDAPARIAIPIEQQKIFVRKVCEKIGFDFDAGRLDESAHPFCEGIGPGDTRMTNRYRPDGWTDALGTAMHESGHGLYEQGLPKDDMLGQPLAEAVSLGIHESQSRMWENLVGRSRPFWQWAFAEAAPMLGEAAKKFTVDDVYRAVNIIEPTLIRVESDEVTYNLHIMLRFDLERAMVNGDLSPRDLAGVWNQRMKSDLGLAVPDDRRGCLQDVHWSAGLVGYFPTYTFGNLYAAQFWEAMGKSIEGREALIAKGEFAPILGWLRENIHKHGRRYTAPELCERVTGTALTHDALLRHLGNKVSAVYSVAGDLTKT